MAFKVTEREEAQHYVEVSERLWLAEDGETVVSEGDPRAALLLASAGKRLSREDAERYGLVKSRKPTENKQAQPAEEKAADLIARMGDMSAEELQELRKDDRKTVVSAAEKELRAREESGG